MHYLTEPIDVNDVSGGGGTNQRTQSEFFATANNTASQSIASFISSAYGSAVVANICNVTIINNDAGAVTITSPSGTVSLASGASMQLGNGSRKLTGLGNITLGAGLTSYTIMWSELDA